MKQVVRWTDAKGVKAYKGSHENDCSRCRGGNDGDLLLCKLCTKSANKECVGFDVDDEDFEYFCDNCINSWYSINNEKEKNQLLKMKQVIECAKEEEKCATIWR